MECIKVKVKRLQLLMSFVKIVQKVKQKKSNHQIQCIACEQKIIMLKNGERKGTQ